MKNTLYKLKTAANALSIHCDPTHRLLCHWILIHLRKGHIGVVFKMFTTKLALFQFFLGECSLDLHHQLQRLIVRLAWKKYLTCKNLEDHTTHSPQVHGIICSNHQPTS